MTVLVSQEFIIGCLLPANDNVTLHNHRRPDQTMKMTSNEGDSGKCENTVAS